MLRRSRFQNRTSVLNRARSLTWRSKLCKAKPEESWWVKDAALHVIGHAPADWVAPHVDLLLPISKHEDWWLQNATLDRAYFPSWLMSGVTGRCSPLIGELVQDEPALGPHRRPA